VLDLSKGLSMTKAQPTDLYLQLGTARAPVLIDMRTELNSDPDQRLIVSARPMPVTPEQWTFDLESGEDFVVYDDQGDEASEGVAEALSGFGKEARYLDGGFAAWVAAGLPTRRQLAADVHKWITRERPKIDRIACPWLIRRFIDPDAEFIYVPADQVLDEAKTLSAIPYDIPDVEFTHEGERCSFDTFLRIYDIADPPLERLALIVRGADTSRHELAPQCAGLFAISLGLSANFSDDHEMLEHGMVVYDALYMWSRSLQAETHGWPPKR
jgi:rhodanese-related sulfurtransferase